MGFKHGLYVRRIDVLPTGKNHVLLAIDDIQEAVLVEAADVAGPEPRASVLVVPQCLGRGVGPVVVPALKIFSNHPQNRYRGCILIAPSKRIVSPLSMLFSMI